MAQYKTEGVVFNLDDPDQRGLWEHARRRKNFSAYVKRLIQRDKEGVMPAPVVMESRREEEPATLELSPDLMNGLL